MMVLGGIEWYCLILDVEDDKNDNDGKNYIFATCTYAYHTVTNTGNLYDEWMGYYIIEFYIL